MEHKLPAHQNELYRRVDEVLTYILDPIKVSGIPEARDEYFPYLPRVFSLLVDPSEPGKIAEYLIYVAGDQMGLNITDKAWNDAKEVEDILRNYKEFIYGRAKVKS